jgi:NOL1/NOP2/fmu family ribosome biogenesis protein
MENRFGIPGRLFENYLLFKRKKSWRLLKNIPRDAEVSKLKVTKIGLKAFEKVGAFVKPTTRMIQIFGESATKARVEIDEEQLVGFLAGEELRVDLDLDAGYVILVLRKNRILGLGFFINGRVRAQIPRKQLTQVL